MRNKTGATVCEDREMSFAGRLLVATPLIRDPNFSHTVVYVYAHVAEEGAAGVVLNRPTEEPTGEHLPEWRSILAPPPIVFWGGPVASTSGVVLMVESGEVKLAEDLEPPAGRAKARLFVGQAGWGPGQLEGEVDEGAWIVMDASPDDVLVPFPDSLWSRVLRRHGGPPAMWATLPIDPSVN
jgi:putative transcriptional regulator